MYTPSRKSIEYVIKDLRNPRFAQSAAGDRGPGFVVWYDHGAEMMQFLHDNYGLEFKTPFATCVALADTLQRQFCSQPSGTPE